MSKKTLLLTICAVFLSRGTVFSLDMGGVLSQDAALEAFGAAVEPSDFNYSATLSPWLSWVPADNLLLYLSASVAGQYEAEKWKPLFEVGRFELSWQPRPNIFLEAGRFAWADPLGVTASGLFDGASGSFGLGKSRLFLGAFYTGLLHKQSANITMSAGDSLDYMDDGHYWAPSRTFGAAVYTLPGLFSWRDTLRAGLIGQFDLRKEERDRLHTQYLILQYNIVPLDALSFELGGIFALNEAGTEDPRAAYALAFTGNWALPTRINDLMSIRFRYASGRREKNLDAFSPITGTSQSNVIDARLSGLMALSMIHSIRFSGDFSLSKETVFLMRTDGVSFAAEDLDPASESALLGLELFFKLVWAPLSDLSLNLGGGFFMPLPESAFYSTTPEWKISAGLVISF
jgi:hypothetical protein